MAGFSFFDNKEPPKLPSTPGSNFGSLANMPCFTFGAPKNSSSSNDVKVFSFGFNPVKPTDATFDVKMEELSQSLSSITSQPLSVNLTKNKSISERTKRISSLENALAEIQIMKDKMSNMECSIAKFLMDELDSMKENVSGCINPFNSMQIVEQKSVSTSPTQNFEYQKPNLFPFGVLSNPITKPKTKLFSNFKPQRVSLPLVFNAPSDFVSGSTVPTSASVSTNVATITATTVPASIGGNAAPPLSADVAFNFGVVPNAAAETINDNTLDI